jgi:hypothetical protein
MRTTHALDDQIYTVVAPPLSLAIMPWAYRDAHLHLLRFPHQ